MVLDLDILLNWSVLCGFHLYAKAKAVVRRKKLIPVEMILSGDIPLEQAPAVDELVIVLRVGFVVEMRLFLFFSLPFFGGFLG
jgi:hypothetical protein